MPNHALKTSLIEIGSYALIIVFMIITHFWYQDLSSWFHDFGVLFFLFSLLRWILSIIWNNENTKKLKHYLLIIESYLGFLILIKPELNLNHWEFFFFYSWLLLIFSTLYDYDYKSRILKTVLWSLISFFFLSIHFLVIYTQPLNFNDFFDQQQYYLYFYSDWIREESIPQYFQIKYTQWNTNKIWSKNQDFSFLLPSFSPQKISYLTTLRWQQLLIQDKWWNILEIPSWSEVSFSSKEHTISYESKGNKPIYHPFNGLWSGTSIKTLQENYFNAMKYFALSTLPNHIKNSPFLQNISYRYTRFLATIIPFYSQNWKIADDYFPFFDMKNLWETQRREIIKNTDSTWVFNSKSVMWKTKIFDHFFSSLSRYFHNLFTKNSFIQEV